MTSNVADSPPVALASSSAGWENAAFKYMRARSCDDVDVKSTCPSARVDALAAFTASVSGSASLVFTSCAKGTGFNGADSEPDCSVADRDPCWFSSCNCAQATLGAPITRLPATAPAHRRIVDTRVISLTSQVNVRKSDRTLLPQGGPGCSSHRRGACCSACRGRPCA